MDNNFILINIKNLCSAKDTVRMGRQATDRERIFAKDILIKDCYPKYTKNS